MAKFKLVQKVNPQKRNEPARWFAIPKIVARMTTRAVCKYVTRNTTVAPTEAEATLNLVLDAVPQLLKDGNSAQIGNLGWLRLSFGSEGVEEPGKFNAESMMRNLKIVFTPSKELVEEVSKGIAYESAGIVEEGFTFPTLKAYNNYKATGRFPIGGDEEEESGAGQ